VFKKNYKKIKKHTREQMEEEFVGEEF